MKSTQKRYESKMKRVINYYEHNFPDKVDEEGILKCPLTEDSILSFMGAIRIEDK